MYHDPELVFEGKAVEKGEGRIISYLGENDSIEMITAGFTSTDNPKRNMGFGRTRYLDKEVDVYILGKGGKKFVAYVKTEGVWKRGVCGEEENFKDIKEVIEGGRVVPEKRVARYEQLANDFKQTYFKE